MSIYFENFYEFINLHMDKILEIKKQYLYLLNQLTVVEDISIEKFTENIKKISSTGIIFIGIKYNKNEFDLLCTGTIIIEPKIIRGGRSVGHIEDIIVDSKCRGQGISQLLLNELKIYAEQCDCYKIMLDCSENVMKIYERNSFIKKDNHMVIYL